MATRGYPPPQHHYQQQPGPPPARNYGYDQRPDPRYQDPQQRMPPQRQPQYDGYQDQRGYQNDYGYSQQGQYREQNHDPYHYNDYQQNDHRGHPPPQRQYNYDERYHQNGQGRQPPLNPQGYPEQRPRDRPQHQQPRSPPRATEPVRQKPRERILTRPESPETLAWDNPFGAFPAKKKEGPKKDEAPEEKQHRRHGSLDAMQHRPNDWNTPPPRPEDFDARPNTSQDHRKRNEPPRPNTSHGQRPRMSPPLNAGDDRWGRSKADLVGTAPQRPPMPPSEPRPGPSQRIPLPTGGPRPGPAHRPPMPAADPRPGPPQRSATQPNSTTGQMGVNGYDYNQPQHSQFEIVTDRRPPVRQPSDHQYDHQYDREPERGPPLAKARTFDQGPRSPDMPNFNAMAPNTTETLTGPKVSEQPSYAKKSYQTLTINPVSGRPPPPRAAESPLAEFSFGLPHSSSAPHAIEDQLTASQRDGPGPIVHNSRNGFDGEMDYNNPPISPFVPGDRSQGYDRRIGPSAPETEQGRSMPVQQFPPRKASRPEPGPGADPYASEQQDSGYWTSSPERNHPPARAAPPAHGYDEFVRGPDWDQGYPEDQPYQRGNHDQYGQPPLRQPGYPPNGSAQVPPRPHTSNSARGQPLRHYGDRVSGPDMPPPVAGGIDRPPPFRPGLMNQPPTQPQPLPQPPPVRQQPQQAPPMRPQQTPMPQAPPQDSRPQSGQSDEAKPPVTIAELNNMREQFKENPNDFALGLRFAKRLVEAAKVLSSENGRADPKQVARNRERYVNDAHKVVKKLVNAGSAEAMFYLADCYGQGSLGLPVDAKEAFQLYQSAAKLNHAQSAYRVAVCCELGHEEGGGTRRDPMKAIQWYKRAATLGDTPAMYKMGMILLKGLLGQPRNPREAVSWLKRAAERADKENPHALHELGLLYESARPEDHILRDESYAFQLFHQSAELGYKYSQFRMGSAYEYGALGCPVDQRQSIAWYSRAAAQGEHQSELALSGWYLTGAGDLVKQNDQEAFLWARKAASSGLAKAEFAMGYFAENGIGTTVDLEEAKRWYYRAAAQGFPKAKERLEELKMGAKAGKKRDLTRRSNAKEGDCVVM